MTRPDDAVARYLRALDRLGAVVEAVPAERWDAPTPCSGWSARHLVGHLVDAQGQVLAMLAGEDPRAPVTGLEALGALAGRDRAGSWRRAHQAAVSALATATGRPADLDPDAVQALLPGVLALGGQLQASGMYGPPVPVPDDAPAQDRLLAALGRRPHGSPG
ncbi:TIGR03083 family protein [Geodermatophilus obscurus]|uniref:TIGR03083 family protein n=1 Tax=Geodermatophilus obscurus TaxID=1861 RepID=A0A1M7UCL1_9ACTN|nr:maleylpyruvate isomerase N-terminal domain-containing protein [Geodermatophilus obscurus]SHN80688.1 TIGR03083 family protein [Geodermatophilus obscurus]